MRWIRMTFALLLLLSLAAGAVLYRKFPRNRVEPVTVVEASYKNIEQIISATGSVEPRRKVMVTTEPGTRVAALYFHEQDIVANGQVLAKLDDAELSTQRRQTEGALRLAAANLTSAEATLAQTKALYEKGFVARQESEAAQRQVDLSQIQVEEKEAALKLIKTKLDRSLIRAPISGAITRKFVEVGGVVSNSGRSPGQSPGGQFQPMAIAEIVHLGALEFHVDVDQTDVSKIKRGQRAVIALDAFPDQKFAGVVEEITLSNVDDMGERVRYKVRVTLQKPEAPLRLGMTGTIDFILARKDNVLALPTSVILQREEREYVLVVDGNQAHLRAIHTGLKNEEVAEVIAGLRAGEPVIDQGRGKVKDGQTVEVLHEKR